MSWFIALLASFILIGSMLWVLSSGPQRLQKISGWILGPTLICGIFFYTTGYTPPQAAPGELLSAVLRGVHSSCLMLVGRNDYLNMQRINAWFVGDPWFEVLFWLAHLAALFVALSAVLSTLGRKLAQRLQLLLSSSKALYVVYGLNEASVALGKELGQNKRNLVVFIEPPAEKGAPQAGVLVRREAYLPGGDVNRTFLKSLGFTSHPKRQLTVLAFCTNQQQNVEIADRLLVFCREVALPAPALQVLIRCASEVQYSHMHALEQEDSHPFYNVEGFCEAQLAARMLMRQAPPYRSIPFGPTGKATQNFTALILGFGEVGQQVLRTLIMNAQFNGSKLSVCVVDKTLADTKGRFARRYPGLLENYDITFHALDSRSEAFYELLDEQVQQLRYIVVCQGGDEANDQALLDIDHYYTRLAPALRQSVTVSVCNKRYVATARDHTRYFDDRKYIIREDILLRRLLDRMAMAVHLNYAELAGQPGEAHALWSKTDAFSRESSRASADFLPAMLHMAGFTPNTPPDAPAFAQHVTGELLESLSLTEHLRWNAFHYAMGYTLMPIQELQARAAAGLTPLQKDAAQLRHACLVPWEDLDELSALVSRLGGTELDYKEMDRANVRNIPRTLLLAQQQHQTGALPCCSGDIESAAPTAPLQLEAW